MACTTRVHLVVILLLALLLNSLTYSASESADKYVRDACSVTRYRDLCIRSLSTFSSIAKNNPIKWARAGVSVSLGEANSVTKYLTKLKNSKSLRGKHGVTALSDCVEVFQDAIDELHKSLGTLRKISNRQYYDAEMSDLLTWMSAVLTYEDTCLDGFEGQNGSLVKMLRQKVSNASYMTSNALALVNRLASSGVGNEPNS